MARRGNSTSIILLLVCLILLVGGVMAGYVAIDKKIIENPFASLLQGEPMTLPSSEPNSVPATSTEETDFFMKTERPKPGTAPFLSSLDEFNLTPGTTINCRRFAFKGDSTGTIYRYMGKTEVRKYPNASIAQSWGAPASTAISCRGLIKGSDMKGNWPTGTTVKCTANDKKGSSHTLYYYMNPGTLMAYETEGAVDYYNPNWKTTMGTIPDCSDYTLDSSYTIFDPRPPVAGGLAENTPYKIKYGGNNNCYAESNSTKCNNAQVRLDGVITTHPGHQFTISRGTNSNYPHVIYNSTKGTWCISDTLDDDGESYFLCPTDVANTDSRAQFNIESQGNNTYKIKSNTTGQYCGRDGQDNFRCDNKVGPYAFAFEPIGGASTVAGATMPPNLPELKNLPTTTEAVYCKAYPPVGGTTETLYKYSDGNTLQPYIDKLTQDSWATEFANNTANANCMGAKLGDTIGYGRWRQGRTVKCGDTYYAFYRQNRLLPYEDYAHAKSHDPNDVDTALRIGDCSYYTIGETMWKYPSKAPDTSSTSWMTGDPGRLDAKPSPSPPTSWLSGSADQLGARPSSPSPSPTPFTFEAPSPSPTTSTLSGSADQLGAKPSPSPSLASNWPAQGGTAGFR